MSENGAGNSRRSQGRSFISSKSGAIDRTGSQSQEDFDDFEDDLEPETEEELALARRDTRISSRGSQGRASGLQDIPPIVQDEVFEELPSLEEALDRLGQPIVHYGMLSFEQGGRLAQRFCVLFPTHLDSWDSPRSVQQQLPPWGQIWMRDVKGFKVSPRGFALSLKWRRLGACVSSPQKLQAWSDAIVQCLTERRPDAVQSTPGSPGSKVAHKSQSRERQADPHMAVCRASSPTEKGKKPFFASARNGYFGEGGIHSGLNRISSPSPPQPTEVSAKIAGDEKRYPSPQKYKVCNKITRKCSVGAGEERRGLPQAMGFGELAGTRLEIP